MFQSIQKLAERISSLIAEKPFSCGFFTGLAAVFAILLFLLLLHFVSRPRKLRCIVIPSEGGNLRIDAKAVQGAVRSVAEKFSSFDVRHVGLYGKQNAPELEVAMDFNGGNASVSVLAAQFRAAVARMMTETFGMETPARIELEILHSGADIPVGGAESAGPGGDAQPGETSSSEEPSETGQSC